MHREFLMGNEAMALGALAAGVNVVAGYPGTPSTEVLETIAKRNPGRRRLASNGCRSNEKAGAWEVGGQGARPYCAPRNRLWTWAIRRLGSNVALRSLS